MRKRTFCFVVLVTVVFSINAQAADNGQTHPKLSFGCLYGSSNTWTDIVPLTSGSGNVKGVNCTASSGAPIANAAVAIYVDGGSAQTLSLQNAVFLMDSSSIYYTGYIPMNVRFGSSIKVQVTGTAWSGVGCSVSWALD